MSRLSAIYEWVYGTICGRHPNELPWHFQWLSGRNLHAELRAALSDLEDGKVLDVGCGKSPYKSWLGAGHEYIGIDVVEGSEVDVIVGPNETWPFEKGFFDSVLCTQVLEHVVDIDHFLGETRRVLRIGGKIVITVPFIYSEHGDPWDCRRFSGMGLEALFSGPYDVLQLKKIGGFGSSGGTLLLNWCENAMSLNIITKLMKGFLLPVWIMFSAVVNIIGFLGDALDKTGSFYGNVLLVAQKVKE